MARSAEARRRMIHGRRWSVYEATGVSAHPLKLVACIRANAKSIARGAVQRSRGIPNNKLVVVEGCAAGQTAYATHVFRGARRRRRRR